MRSRWLDISQFFVCVLWTKTEFRSIKTRKKRARPIFSQFSDRTMLVNKGFNYMAFGESFSRGTWQEVLSGQDSAILPTWVANHTTGFGLSCPLKESYNEAKYRSLEHLDYTSRLPCHIIISKNTSKSFCYLMLLRFSILLVIFKGWTEAKRGTLQEGS